MSKPQSRPLSLLERAILASAILTVLAVVAPAFARSFRARHQDEAREGLELVRGAVERYYETHRALPPSIGLTPAEVPRGAVVDPPQTWTSWESLGVVPVATGLPHRYSFRLETAATTVVLEAHGDLDGDGEPAVFAQRGEVAEGGGKLHFGPIFCDHPLE